MPKRFRGEFLTIGRYTNLSTFAFYLCHTTDLTVGIESILL